MRRCFTRGDSTRTQKGEWGTFGLFASVGFIIFYDDANVTISVF